MKIILYNTFTEISPEISEQIIQILLLGGELKKDAFYVKINKSKSIAVALNSEGTVVGVVALKIKEDEFNDSAFSKSGSLIDYNSFNFELGYMTVLKEYRGSGIASQLCERILESSAHENIFATTREDNLSSQNVLIKIGFNIEGKPFNDRSNLNKLLLLIKNNKA